MLATEIDDSLSRAFEEIKAERNEPATSTKGLDVLYREVFVAAPSESRKPLEIFSLVDPSIRLVTAASATGD